MHVKNTTGNPITIAGVHIIAAKSVREFSADLWDKLRARPSVVFWLGAGTLQEVDPAAEAAAAEAVAFAAEQRAAEEAERDPLDHDGDGRKGGSKKKKAS